MEQVRVYAVDSRFGVRRWMEMGMGGWSTGRLAREGSASNVENDGDGMPRYAATSHPRDVSPMRYPRSSREDEIPIPNPQHFLNLIPRTPISVLTAHR